MTSGGDGENSGNVVIDPSGVQTAVGQVSSVIRPYEQAAMSINATQLLGYDDELDIEPAIADLTNAGLQNVGNTCYLNALLFCFSKLKIYGNRFASTLQNANSWTRKRHAVLSARWPVTSKD